MRGKGSLRVEASKKTGGVSGKGITGKYLCSFLPKAVKAESSRMKGQGDAATIQGGVPSTIKSLEKASLMTGPEKKKVPTKKSTNRGGR